MSNPKPLKQMKQRRNNSQGASTLQIALSTGLISSFALLLVIAAPTNSENALRYDPHRFQLVEGAAADSMATLGNYPDTSILLSTDTIVTPDASPTPAVTPSPTITPPPTQCTVSQQFFTVWLGIPAGWSATNNSTVPGAFAFFQGNTTMFPAQFGESSSYIAANYNADEGPGVTDTISDWLLTPPVQLQNGAKFSFWTRTVTTPAFPDRLQVRYSRNGTSQNVGVGPTGVGDFGTIAEGGTGNGDLLLDINPAYLLTGVGSYPNVWTNFTITLSGITGTPTGRLAFRYFVENGGINGVNSDYIGIDTVSYDCNGIIPAPTPVTPTPGPPSLTPIPCVTLFSQTDSPGTNAVNSQDFEPANDAFDNQAADDFVVPAGPAWAVQEVVVNGAYFNGAPPPGGPATFFDVFFYGNGGTKPGALVAAVHTCGYTLVGNVFTIYLWATVTLPANATYWVSVRASMDFGAPTAGQWGWTNRTVTSGSPAAWQNPGGGFSTACNSWGARGVTCGIAPTEPDQIFQIRGCLTRGSPTPAPTPSPTSTPLLNISGTVTYCSGPTPNPVAGVTMTLTGGPGGSTVTAANGTYSFTNLPAGLNYAVTPSKAARVPGTANIDTVDVIAVQRHFLIIAPLPTGCRLSAADVSGDIAVDTVDVVAIQRFFLGMTTGIANAGKYKFSPANRTYAGIVTDQTGQNYDVLIFGDVASPFAE